MGKDNKLTLPIKGKAMVSHPVEAAQLAGIDPVVVVTGHKEIEVQYALAGYDVRFISNPDYAEGLSTSLKTGIAALPDDVTHALVLLGDMPEITGDMIGKMLAIAKNGDPSAIIMATHNGKRGNPVLWPKAFFEALQNVVGDTGARHIIGQNAGYVIEVELGAAASLDIDTPEAFETFKAKS